MPSASSDSNSQNARANNASASHLAQSSAPSSTQNSSQTKSSVAVNEAPQAGSIVLDEAAIQRALTRIAHEIMERNASAERLYLVAIPNGGVPLARALQAKLQEISGVETPVGVLDTTLYRDDLSQDRGKARPAIRHTEMPSAVDGRIVILVDDVVNTGRTIRAAMDALMDFGRPQSVQLAGLVDRGHRELPIRCDYVGKNVPTQKNQNVVLRGENGTLDGPLEVVLLDAATTEALR